MRRYLPVASRRPNDDREAGNLTDPRDDEGVDGYVPTLRDVLRRWRYTLVPTLYTNEDSSTDDLLWQQILETRAARAWLVLVFAALVVGVVVLALVLIEVAGR